MKQLISKEQWEELTEEQKHKWKYEMVVKGTGFDTGTVPPITIGQMIEYLGDDLTSMQKAMGMGELKWHIGINGTQPLIYKKELADALWEAVKHKLEGNNH